MAREGAGRDQDGVDAKIVAGARVTRGQHFRRRRHPAQARHIERLIQRGAAVARLDLDKGERPSPPRNKVDFTDPRTDPLCDDAPAVEAQPPCGDAFRPPPRCLRLCPRAGQRSLSASSRARA